MAHSGVWVAFMDVGRKKMAMSIMEGRPIATDFQWGKHWTIEIDSAIVHVFTRGEPLMRHEIEDMLKRWDRGDFKNLLNQK